MQTLHDLIETQFKQAFLDVGLDKDSPVLVVEASKPEFGDYQVNGVMQASKKIGKNPREIANLVVSKIIATNQNKCFSKMEIAGPGFINLTLKDDYLSSYVHDLSSNNHFGVKDAFNQTIVVDLSSPNLAKEMHVGHLRSTVIGDSLARIFEYLGYNVIRQNHVGDWGTQFGMLIAYLEESQAKSQEGHKINDLEVFYRNAKVRFDEDDNFANKAREYVVILQNWQSHGELGVKVHQYWVNFCKLSGLHCQEVYDALKVKLDQTNMVGESFYNRQLNDIIKTLEDKKLIVESNNAKCVFFEAGELPGGEETPFIVQKQDGGFLYSTTDLAAMDYRVHTLHADRIVYVVDARQSFHFKQLFLVGKKAGFAKSDTLLEHSAFGTMMNEDGRPFKTRDGGTVKLIDLIIEAKRRALHLVTQRNPSWSEAEKQDLADIIAIGAIKYADLSKNRTSDYIFSFDKMLSFEGNTAPYLLYAYTRIQSIFKKANSELNLDNLPIILTEVSEHRLALQIAKFPEMIRITAKEDYPHYLCQYLYTLSGIFMQFYESCTILNAGSEEVKNSRLALAYKAAQLLNTGLGLLGIEVVERM